MISQIFILTSFFFKIYSIIKVDSIRRGGWFINVSILKEKRKL